MSFIYAQAITPAVFLLVIFVIFWFRYEIKYFNWVKLYWFHRRSRFNFLSSIFFISSCVLLTVALLDLRGPEEKVKTNVPDQKTIILIDASSSMLVEDVRPNRFERSLFLARHFIRNATGHQLAVILFSDRTKRVVSFTDDLDLLDARIQALEKTDLSSAGSNISTSLNESVRYFIEQSGDSKASGNILLFTDGEETLEGAAQKLPEDVALAVVGVGTAKGGRIPLRSDRGSFRGYKRHDGEEVVSKLDEDWLRDFGKEHDLYKYWVALSYNVPTQDVLSFYATVYDKKLKEGEIRYRPVYGYPLIIGFLLSLSISCLLSLKPSFKIAKAKKIIPCILFAFLSFVVSFSVSSLNVYAQTKAVAPDEKAEIEYSDKTMKLLEEIKKRGDVEDLKLKLAESTLKDGDQEMALKSYEEFFEIGARVKESEYIASRLNYATLLLALGENKDAVEALDRVELSSLDEATRNTLRSNIVNLLMKKKQEQQKSQEGQENQEESESGENKEQKKSNSEGSQGEDESNQQQGSAENEQKKENEKSGEEGDDQKENEEQEQEDDNEDEGPNDELEAEEDQEEGGNEPDSWEEKRREIERKKRMKKELPALLQQIRGQDTELQKQQLDTRTNDGAGTNKDW